MQENSQVLAIREKFLSAIVECCFQSYRRRHAPYRRESNPAFGRDASEIIFSIGYPDIPAFEWERGLGLFRRQDTRRSVDLSFMFTEDMCKAAIVVMCRLAKVAHINDLLLHHNRLCGRSLRLLANLLRYRDLHHLDLSHNLLEANCATDLVQLLLRCEQLSSLDLSHNPLGDVGVTALCQAIADVLKKERRRSPMRQDPGVSPSNGTFRRACSFSTPKNGFLSASNQKSSSGHGWSSFVRTKIFDNQISSTLRDLHLRHVGLGDDGLTALADLLPSLNIALLDLADNPITERGLTALGNVLYSMKALCAINLSYLSQVKDWQRFLCRLLGSSVQKLSLCGNHLDAPCFRQLCTHIVKRLPKLDYLNVSGCSVAYTPWGCRWLMDAVRDGIRHGRQWEVCSHKDMPIQQGWTSLHKICLLGEEDQPLGKPTLPLNFPIMERDAYGRSLLHLVCESGSIKLYDTVMCHIHTFVTEDRLSNMLLNQEDVNGESALMVASLRGHVRLVNALLDAGAHVSRSCFEAMLQIDNEHTKCIHSVDRTKQISTTSVGDDEVELSPRSPTKRQHERLCRKGKRVLETIIDRLTPHCSKYLRASAFQRFFSTFLFYVIFLLSFTVLAGYHCTGFQNTKFTVMQVVNDHLTGELLNDGKGNTLRMKDVRKVSEFWQWMQTTFVPAMFPSPEVQTTQLVLLDYNDIVGAVRIRQLRVRNDTCGDSGDRVARGKNITCYGTYSEKNEDRQDLGPEAWQRWRSASELGGHSYTSEQFGVTYGGGGYVVDLRQNITQVKKFLKHLQQNRWIDDPTRMVALEFTLFNPFVGQYIAARLIFEIPASGGIFPVEHFVTFRLERYTYYKMGKVHFSLLPILFEAFVFLCFVRLVFEEIQDLSLWWMDFKMERERLKVTFREEAGPRSKAVNLLSSLRNHFLRDWNGIDLIVILLFTCIYVVRGLMLMESYRVWSPDLLLNQSKYVDFHWIVELHLWEQDFIAFAMVFCWLKVLKYIVILPSVGPAVQAIISTIIDQHVVSFMLVFIIVSLAFSMALHFALGYGTVEYSTLGTSGMSYFRMLFGDFHFVHFKSSDNWGSFWFVMSLLSGSMLLVNIFVAVLGQVYEAQLECSIAQWQRKAVLEYQKQLWMSSRLEEGLGSSYFAWIRKLVIYQPLSAPQHLTPHYPMSDDQDQDSQPDWTHYVIQEEAMFAYLATPKDHLDSRTCLLSTRHSSLMDVAPLADPAIPPEVQRLHREMGDLSQELVDLRMENARLQHLSSTSKEERDRVVAENAQLSEEVDGYEKQTKVLRADKETLAAELQALKAELAKMQEQGITEDAMKKQEETYFNAIRQLQDQLQDMHKEHHTCNRAWRTQWEAIQDLLGTLLPQVEISREGTHVVESSRENSMEVVTPRSSPVLCPQHGPRQTEIFGHTQSIIETVAQHIRGMTITPMSDSQETTTLGSPQSTHHFDGSQVGNSMASDVNEELRQRNKALAVQVMELKKELEAKQCVLAQVMAQLEQEHSRNAQGPRFTALKQKLGFRFPGASS